MMTPDPFQHYQPEGPIPGRPWWRHDPESGCIVRPDGLFIVYITNANGWRIGWTKDPPQKYWFTSHAYKEYPDLVAALDREHPRGHPPALLNQGWVWPSHGGQAATTTRIIPRSGGQSTIQINGEWWDSEKWPPEGAVLVTGPGAPWAPRDYPFDEEAPS